MRTRVLLGDQVSSFLRTLAPEPRRALRRALHQLEAGRGDLKALEGEFVGFWRLRAGRYRVVLKLRHKRGRQVAECIFAEERSVVYELFAQMIHG